MKFYIEYTPITPVTLSEKESFWKYWRIGLGISLNFNQCSFQLPKPNQYWNEKRLPNRKLTGNHRFSMVVNFCRWSFQLTGYNEKVF